MTQEKSIQQLGVNFGELMSMYPDIKKHVYGADLIYRALEALKEEPMTPKTYMDWQYLITYCFIKIPEGYLPLSRSYAPVGSGGQYVRYEDFGFLAIPKELFDVDAALTIKDSNNTEKQFWLYKASSPENEKTFNNYLKNIYNVLFKNYLLDRNGNPWGLERFRAKPDEILDDIRNKDA